MNIIIGADLVPTNSNVRSFIMGKASELVDEGLLSLLHNADYSVFNLETPITDFLNPIKKCGPNLSAPESSVEGFRSLGVKLLSLANNHIMDQGDQGLEQTISALKKTGIDFFGAGKNKNEASKPLIIEIEGKKIGFYACVEHEFSVASKDKPGANPFDPLESFDAILQLKSKCDFLVVLYHGGKEQFRYPSPILQDTCRKFVEKGANLVLCQHSHCIGCEEKYENGTIVYGQGNFLFDNCNNEFWQTGMLVSITDNFLIRYIWLRKRGEKVGLADDSEEIERQFLFRSEQIRDRSFVESNYAAFAALNIDFYLSTMMSLNQGIIFRILNKISKGRYKKRLLEKKYNLDTRTVVLNCIECESHRELLIEGLKRYDSQK